MEQTYIIIHQPEKFCNLGMIPPILVKSQLDRYNTNTYISFDPLYPHYATICRLNPGSAPRDPKVKLP